MISDIPDLNVYIDVTMLVKVEKIGVCLSFVFCSPDRQRLLC